MMRYRSLVDGRGRSRLRLLGLAALAALTVRPAGDSRPALEERYGTHAGYAAALQDAADALLQAGFLRPDDRDRIVAAAEAGDVLR